MASSTARAGAVVLEQLELYAAARVEVPRSNLTDKTHISIFIHGIDSESCLTICDVGGSGTTFPPSHLVS